VAGDRQRLHRAGGPAFGARWSLLVELQLVHAGTVRGRGAPRTAPCRDLWISAAAAAGASRQHHCRPEAHLGWLHLSAVRRGWRAWRASSAGAL
jgi:hypothetical protein